MITLVLVLLALQAKPFTDPVLATYDGHLGAETVLREEPHSPHEIRFAAKLLIAQGDYAAAIKTCGESLDPALVGLRCIAKERGRLADETASALGQRPLQVVPWSDDGVVALIGRRGSDEEAQQPKLFNLHLVYLERSERTWRKTWVSAKLDIVVKRPSGLEDEDEFDEVSDANLFVSSSFGNGRSIVLHLQFYGADWAPSTAYVFQASASGWRQIARVGSQGAVIAKDLDADGRFELIGWYDIGFEGAGNTPSHAEQPGWEDVWQFRGQRFEIANRNFPDRMESNRDAIQDALVDFPTVWDLWEYLGHAELALDDAKRAKAAFRRSDAEWRKYRRHLRTVNWLDTRQERAACEAESIQAYERLRATRYDRPHATPLMEPLMWDWSGRLDYPAPWSLDDAAAELEKNPKDAAQRREKAKAEAALGLYHESIETCGVSSDAALLNIARLARQREALAQEVEQSLGRRAIVVAPLKEGGALAIVARVSVDLHRLPPGGGSFDYHPYSEVHLCTFRRTPQGLIKAWVSPTLLMGNDFSQISEVCLYAAHVTGDGREEAIVSLEFAGADHGEGRALIYEAKGNSWSQIANVYSDWEFGPTLALKDLNGDGRYELLALNEIGEYIEAQGGPSHAGMPHWYDVYEYSDGRYRLANDRFPKIMRVNIDELKPVFKECPHSYDLWNRLGNAQAFMGDRRAAAISYARSEREASWVAKDILTEDFLSVRERRQASAEVLANYRRLVKGRPRNPSHSP